MSNMVVATNVLALNSHRSMKVVGTKQAKASARLSSGYRINSAADDAAGLSISEKMRAQIRGLNQASRNAQDGISLVQTAEGGMQEIDNMIQRMRELVVQASNDSNDQTMGGKKAQGDRQKIQDELNQLGQEIDSMAERVEFNQKKVINGEYAGKAKLGSTQAAFDTAKTGLTTAQNDVANAEATMNANIGGLKQFGATMQTTIKTALDALDTALASHSFDSVDIGLGIDVKLSNEVNALKEFLTTGDYGQAVEALKNGDTKALRDAINSIGDDMADWLDVGAAASLGKDLANFIAAGTGAAGAGALVDIDGLSKGSFAGGTASIALQRAITDIFDTTTFNLTADLTAQGAFDNLADAVGTVGGFAEYDAQMAALDTAQFSFKMAASSFNSAEKEGGLYLQTGANANQGLQVQIGSIKTDMLGIGDGNGKMFLDVVKASGSEITVMLNTLDDALTHVTTERSKLGAVQNRLEYTINSLDISSENLSASESRIRDADMAKEMMALTQANILQQAATSMLAQANQAPQGVLQLLG